LHVYLHGCTQADKEKHFKLNGLLQYAAANNVVLLEPRVFGTYLTKGSLDPRATCWNVDIDRPILEDPQAQSIL
jgi:hypothetical protein